MMNRTAWPRTTVATALLVFLAGCHTMSKAGHEAPSVTRVHYVEIVCTDVDQQCAVLERGHGLSFGQPVADLGGARVAEASDGSRIAVRGPLADHDLPIVRTYLAVDDITKAVRDAEAAGAVIAYPPTKQGDTGTWAIYILGGVQLGLWQP